MALNGTQPVFGHSLPREAHSADVTLMPSPVQPQAAASPAAPAPMTS